MLKLRFWKEWLKFLCEPLNIAVKLGVCVVFVALLLLLKFPIGGFLAGFILTDPFSFYFIVYSRLRKDEKVP